MNLHFGKWNWFSMGFFKSEKKQQGQINLRLDVDCGPQALSSVCGLTDGPEQGQAEPESKQKTPVW